MLLKTNTCGAGQKGVSLLGGQSFCGFRRDFQILSTKLSTAVVSNCEKTMETERLAHDNAGTFQVMWLMPCF
jgi:hypothetical protein